MSNNVDKVLTEKEIEEVNVIEVLKHETLKKINS